MKKKENFNAFLQLCQIAQKAGKLEELFDLFFTKEEIQVLHSRCKIIEALLKGEMTQREMTAKYHVSIAQITRGSNALKLISSQFKQILTTFRW